MAFAAVGVATFVGHRVWPTFCPSAADETTMVCAREWIGALSGWAAFAAAAASVPYLIRQWQEARKQTSFIIGDDDPTLDVVEHLEEEDRLVVRIVNWNRRAVFVTGISASTKAQPEPMDSDIGIWRIQTTDGVAEKGGFPIQIDGWEHRGERPRFARIDLFLLRRMPGSEPGWEKDERVPFPRDAKITAEMLMLGNVHRVFELEADAFPHE
ncbi:hypothetical protein NKI86_29160 [Mesorhizobium sp. M0320]|uniref:hypothetical protein n=1 Tax=Mesorhizobium sp. M0320 TaxID=2956936 RepID=UPI00333803CB